MESDAWGRFSAAASKRHQSALQSRYADASRDPSLRGWRDLYLGFEELDGGEDDTRAEFPCPFCAEDFDIVGLCCHIDDEHPVEAKNGVCPVCAACVGLDLVGHLTTQHGSFFKEEIPQRISCIPYHAFFVEEGPERRQSAGSFRGSSYMAPPPAAAPDPFISSLIYTLPLDEPSKDAQPESFDEGGLVSKSSDKEVVERVEPSLSDKDQKERARRSEFAQGLVLSTIFDDIL